MPNYLICFLFNFHWWLKWFSILFSTQALANWNSVKQNRFILSLVFLSFLSLPLSFLSPLSMLPFFCWSQIENVLAEIWFRKAFCRQINEIMCCQKYRTLTCPAQQSPSPLSLSGYSFLPGAIEALKNAKNYISKQAKWKETLTKQLCCCPGQVSLHVIWNYYIAHTLIQTHYVCMYTGWAAPDMQHIPLRASSAKWRSFVAKSKSKNEVCNKRRGGEGKKLWNFVRTLPEKNYIDIWFMCS